MTAVSDQDRQSGPRTRSRGFSLTELLVVIGIIALLVGLLLVALDQVQDKAKSVKTTSRMEGFGRACDAFQLDHGYYPGVVPEEILANDPSPDISGTENALLHLMGGFIRREDLGAEYDDTTKYPAPTDAALYDGWTEISFSLSGGATYDIKVNPSRIGEGPIIDGKPYAPYFTPGANEILVIRGQQFEGVPQLPDLVDAWGQPVGYMRQIRTIGPLTDNPSANPYRPPQFDPRVLTPYTKSSGLGESGQNQTRLNLGGNTTANFSALNNPQSNALNWNIAQIIRHPAFGEPDDPYNGTPRGAYFLFSAGPDGVFFGVIDGAIDAGIPVTLIQSPKEVEEFDDVVRSGGG